MIRRIALGFLAVGLGLSGAIPLAVSDAEEAHAFQGTPVRVAADLFDDLRIIGTLAELFGFTGDFVPAPGQPALRLQRVENRTVTYETFVDMAGGPVAPAPLDPSTGAVLLTYPVEVRCEWIEDYYAPVPFIADGGAELVSGSCGYGRGTPVVNDVVLIDPEWAEANDVDLDANPADRLADLDLEETDWAAWQAAVSSRGGYLVDTRVRAYSPHNERVEVSAASVGIDHLMTQEWTLAYVLMPRAGVAYGGHLLTATSRPTNACTSQADRALSIGWSWIESVQAGLYCTGEYSQDWRVAVAPGASGIAGVSESGPTFVVLNFHPETNSVTAYANGLFLWTVDYSTIVGAHGFDLLPMPELCFGWSCQVADQAPLQWDLYVPTVFPTRIDVEEVPLLHRELVGLPIVEDFPAYPADWPEEAPAPGEVEEPDPVPPPADVPMPTIVPEPSSDPATGDDVNTLGDRIGNALEWLGGSIMDGLGWLGDRIMQGLDHLGDRLVGWLEAIWGRLSWLGSMIQTGFQLMLASLGNVVSMLRTVIETLLRLPEAIVNLLEDTLVYLFVPTIEPADFYEACDGSVCGAATEIPQSISSLNLALNERGSACGPTIPLGLPGRYDADGLVVRLPAPAGCPGNGPGGTRTSWDDTAYSMFGLRTAVRTLGNILLGIILLRWMWGQLPWVQEDQTPLPDAEEDKEAMSP